MQLVARDCPWLFPSPSSKSGHTEDITKPRRIIAAADLASRHITRHTLRHPAITHLVQAGVDLPTVQRVSGHKSFEMVFRYSHQNQQHLQEALSKLDERIVVSSPVDFSATPDQRGYTGTTQEDGSLGQTTPQIVEKIGGPCRDRTYDQRIKRIGIVWHHISNQALATHAKFQEQRCIA